MQKLWQNKDWLETAYQTQGSSSIAKKFGIDDSTIIYWLKKFQIPIRTRKESLQIKFYNRRSFDRQYFKIINSPDKAYWLGYLIADGTMREYMPKHYQTCLELGIKDKQVVENFAKDIKLDIKIQYTKTKARLIITDTEFASYLLFLGMIPRKTGKEQYPNIPSKFNRDFIRGYFDGDGCIRFTIKPRVRSKFHIVCANYDFLLNIKTILEKEANVVFSPAALHKKYTKDTKVWELETANLPNIAKIYDYLYPAKRFLKRKKSKFDQFLQYYIKSKRVIKRYSPNICKNTEILEEIPKTSK